MMKLNKEVALNHAKKDLASRLGIPESEIAIKSVEDVEFPDASLGAPIEDEMAAQIITSGWKIKLQVKGSTYEYRADSNQIRLCDFKGENQIIFGD
ncbi:MAG: hypothetical protein D6687_10095 [Acidobacteria bacterium]|jgi:hypothetical protein|nr:MAG: hypothetical protein D6687_10095 [Acidobacteriota bacterium]GIU81187.1 MAG: hypothetical protein KatS3mg006_0251 [Pyrinomonadaceae bacterium]